MEKQPDELVTPFIQSESVVRVTVELFYKTGQKSYGVVAGSSFTEFPTRADVRDAAFTALDTVLEKYDTQKRLDLLSKTVAPREATENSTDESQAM